MHDDLDAAVLDAYGWSDLLPLLRVAHGNAVAFLSLPPARDGRRDGDLEHPLRHEGGRAQRGGMPENIIPLIPPSQAKGEEERPHPPSAPSPAGGGREESKRAFDEAILERLVALNSKRTAEEARGLVRWLRPEFQNPQAQVRPVQAEMDTGADPSTLAAGAATAQGERGANKPAPWPKDAIDQVRAVADLLAASPAPLSLDDIAARFSARGPWKKRLPPLLDMLVALGRARERAGRYAGA